MTATDPSSSSSSSSLRSVMTSVTSTASVGAASISTTATSTSSSKSYESQLLLSPSFLTCAGAILFRGIPPLPTTSSVVESVSAAAASTWSPPSPPSLSSSSPSSSPAPKPRELLTLAAERLRMSDFAGTVEEDDEQAPPTPSSSSLVTANLQVCIIYHQRKKEFILAKGRKDQFETGLQEAAMRETHEETGYPCKPFPVTLMTRAPVPGADIKDSAEGLPVLNCTEPFALTLRNISPTNVKLIYWFIAEATTSVAEEGTRMPSESAFSSCWFAPEEAIERLTHEHDKNVVRQAVELVRAEIVRRSCGSLRAVAGDGLKRAHTLATTAPSRPVPAV